jgi:hypothetical protein
MAEIQCTKLEYSISLLHVVYSLFNLLLTVLPVFILDTRSFWLKAYRNKEQTHLYHRILLPVTLCLRGLDPDLEIV